METIGTTLDADGNVWIDGKIVTLQADRERFDATTEEDIARQIAEDGAAAGATWARSVHTALGLAHDAFAKQIGVPVATARNREQGERSPHWAARVLLRVPAREPDAVLRALAG